MRACVQRVSQAKVEVQGQVVGAIQKGILVLLGIHREDGSKDVDWIIERLLKMRIFSDDNDKMNLDLKQVDGEILLISQFTLYGKMAKGTRPGFSLAAGGPQALKLYAEFSEKLKAKFSRVQEGIFAADMQVSLVNDGPVTLILDSREEF